MGQGLVSDSRDAQEKQKEEKSKITSKITSKINTAGYLETLLVLMVVNSSATRSRMAMIMGLEISRKGKEQTRDTSDNIKEARLVGWAHKPASDEGYAGHAASSLSINH